jgi:Tfp pilus assembly protein PilN
MEQQINLYQPILGAEKRLFSAQAIAVAIVLFALSLGAISAFAGWRVRSAERAIASIEQHDQARTAATERGLAALHGGSSEASTEARAQQLATTIAAREQVLAAVRRGAADALSGFSARLEALGRQQMDGLWLNRIVLSAGERRLALVGAANDPRLVPKYLDALATERSLGEARFDRFELRRPRADEPSAATIFEVGLMPAAAPAAEAPR